MILRLAKASRALVVLGALFANPGWVTTAWAQEPPAQVVFVCEHGNVKSLIAATLFNQAAEARGLSIRSISRGMNPEAGVPARIADELRKEGADVSGFQPRKLTPSDALAALRLIAIGVDLSQYKTSESETMESWADIPPASVDYAASRAALARHIDDLLAELQAREAR